MGVEVQRDDESVGDGLDLVAVLLQLIIQINVMLEGVQVDVAVIQGVVGGDIIGELDDLQINALLF